MLETDRIVTVTLHPAFDHVIEVKDFQACATGSGRCLAHYPAGKGVNVSRVAGQLGVDTIATGFVGSDRLDAFERHLRDYGCTRAQFLPVAGDTRTNITLIDPDNEAPTHIRTRGFAVRDQDVERLRRKLVLLARAGTTFAFAGSLPPGLEPESFGELLDAVSRQGAAVVTDTSDEALRALNGRRVALLKVNQGELATLSDGPCKEIRQAAAAAATLRRRGIAETVVVTVAAEGALLIHGDSVQRGWVELGADELIANTVGCGDALLAGMLVDLQLRSGGAASERWREALRLGLAAATANAMTSRAAVVSRQDVRRYAERVRFEML